MNRDTKKGEIGWEYFHSPCNVEFSVHKVDNPSGEQLVKMTVLKCVESRNKTPKL